MFRLLAISLVLYFSSGINGAHTGTSSTDTSTAFKQSEELQRQTAVGLVKAAGILLLEKGANPYADIDLAQFIDSAFHLYHNAFDRPLPDLRGLDLKTITSFQLAILGEILRELGASEESTRVFEFVPSSLDDLTPGVYNQEPLDKWDNAVTLVRAVRFLLDQDNADPYKDEKLARLVNQAIYDYNHAFVRAGHTYKPNQPLMTDAKMDELQAIFTAVDTNDRVKMRRRVSQKSQGDEEQEVSSLGAMRAPKVRAQNLVRAVIEILDDTDNNPNEDEELAQLIDDAIEKYSKVYNRRRIRLQGLDEQSQMERKVQEIYSIFEDMENRNADLAKILANLTT